MTDKLGAAMRLYLHANQINPALSATLSGLKEAINTQEEKEAPEKNILILVRVCHE